MHQSEVDAEMATFFREQHEEAATERASDHGNGHKPAQLENESAAELSPEMKRAKERLMSIMRGARLFVPPTPASSHGEKESSEPSKTTVDTSKDAMITSSPVKVIETPVPAEVISGRKRPAVGTLAKHTIFPVRDVLTVKEFDDPLREMTELCRQLRMHNDYVRVREDYCNISIRLNLIGKLAPAYRPLLKSGAAWGDAVHTVIHRDQVIIDLHWCHATKMPLMPLNQDHVALLGDNADFAFDRAWALSCKKWRSEYRALEALCLTTFQQCQMLTLHGPDLAARLKGLGAGWRDSGGSSVSKIATVKRLISQWAERDKRIWSQRDFYEKLWLAREALGPKTSKQQIAELHAMMMGGEMQDRATIRDKLKSLDKHVPVA